MICVFMAFYFITLCSALRALATVGQARTLGGRVILCLRVPSEELFRTNMQSIRVVNEEKDVYLLSDAPPPRKLWVPLSSKSRPHRCVIGKQCE